MKTRLRRNAYEHVKQYILVFLCQYKDILSISFKFLYLTLYFLSIEIHFDDVRSTSHWRECDVVAAASFWFDLSWNRSAIICDVNGQLTVSNLRSFNCKQTQA